MSFKNLLALFSSLFIDKNNDPSALDEMKALVNRSIRAEEQRNLIVHSSWGVQAWGDGRQAVIRMKTTAKTSKGLKFQREELTIEQLESLIDELLAANRAWKEFLYKHLMPNSPVEAPY